MKRFLSLALFLSLILASCSETPTEVPTTTTPAGTTAEAEPDDGFVKDSLPELNFNGDEVSWFCGDYSSAYFDDIYAGEQNGNLVNDAVYGARQKVEERLKVKLNVERYEFAWAGVSEYNDLMKSMIMSGDTTYDAYVGYTLVPLIIEGGYFSDLSQSKYLDLDKPWWNRDCRELMPGDSVWFITGDATMSLIKHSLCVYFNQDLMNSLGKTENMYDVVRSGKWTLDTLESMIKDTYSDLNGDSKADADDRYGLTFGDFNKLRMMTSAMNVDMYTKTKDGYELTFISERTSNVFTRLQKLIRENENVRKPGGNDDSNTEAFASFGGNRVSKAFTAGNSLFTASLVGDAASVLDNSKFNVGMIPFPKYDENQDDYYTSAQRFAHIYIPSTVVGEQNDRAGAVLEAWASECYRSVMPTYFETSLKTRYSNDNDMASMFDLLRANTRVEFGTVFTTVLPLNCELFKQVVNDYNFTSESESLRSKTETQLGELITALTGK